MSRLLRALRLPGIFAALIGSACGRAHAPVPTLDFVPTGDTLLVPYVEAPTAAWLGDQRWAVVAPNERIVAVADFGTKRVTPWTRKSSAYRQPFWVFRAGDSLFIDDWGLGRATVWSLAGNLLGAMPSATGLRGVLPRARDRLGRVYLELGPLAGPDGSGNRDSAAVLRADPGYATIDTIARLAPLDLAEVSGDGGRRFERRILSGNDRWGALPDGSIWVARVNQNRVDWISADGRVHRGEPLPDRALTVTPADREVFLRRFPEELRSTAEQLPFAIVKPPFDGALNGPDGAVWLEKSRAIGDSMRRYQVVDLAGILTREVRHRGIGHLLALSSDLALVAEPYAEGQRLMTFRIPN